MTKLDLLKTLDRVKAWVSALKRETVALWFASRDRRTPWTAKALAVFTVGYALSPIDLIPDFIPVLGFVDDAILLPGLIWLTLRLLPSDVITESRARADAWLASGNARPVNRVAIVVIIAIWLGAAYWAWRLWST